MAQASIAVLGLVTAAKFCGDIKIPEPIIVPTTIAMAAGKPSFLFSPALLMSL
jgi:hypothetical protein